MRSALRVGRGALERRRARDWSPGPPDFVGVGAQRCGTTWWYWLLCDHPEIHRGPKEQHFFDAYYRESFGAADVEAYHRLFRRPPGLAVGEWSPRYMHDFWTPALLRRAAPEAKVLVLLRDPLDRYQSGLSHEVDRFMRGVKRGRKRRHAGAMGAGDALSRSLYARQLKRLFESFPRSQVLVLQYERCKADPSAELRRTYEFLGLRELGHVPSFTTERSGLSHPQVAPTDATTSAAMRAIEPDLAELGTLVPELDLSLWPSWSHGAALSPEAGSG